MEAFNKLRAAARARRDKIIDHARLECEKALSQIAALEVSLCGSGEPERPKNMTAYLTNVMPTDRPFTSPELLAALEESQPWRMWSKQAIDSCIYKLIRTGVLKRHGKAHAAKGRQTTPATYRLASAKIAGTDPFVNATLADAVQAVLLGRSMRLVEIAVAVKEAGYRTVQTNENLCDHIGRALRKDSRFTRDGERWTCR